MKKFLGKPIKFARWGGLSPVKQKGYNKKNLETAENTKDFGEYLSTRHSPPARKGIYAFLWPFIDVFLLSGYDCPETDKCYFIKVEEIRGIAFTICLDSKLKMKSMHMGENYISPKRIFDK